jgi:MFS family permease
MKRRRRALYASMLVDTVGSGLLGSFVLLYGSAVAGLSLSAAGAALSVATAVAIAAGPVAGALVDKVEPVAVAAAANATAAVGCVLLLAAHSTLLFAAATFALAAGARAFWATFSALVAAIVDTGDRRAWFVRIRGLRYAGLAAGQALSAPILLLGERRGLTVLVAADAVSFAAAALLLRRAAGMPARAPDASPRGDAGYRAALADGGNVLYAALNIVATLIVTAPLLAMPVLVLSQLGLPGWLPGAIAALNTAALALPAVLGSRVRRLSITPTTVLLRLAAMIWVAGLVAVALCASSRPLAFVLLPVAFVVLGLGELAYAPAADALPVELAPTGLVGRYTAVHQLAWGVSGAIAPALVGALLVHGRATLWLVLAALAAGLAAAYGLAATRASR